MFLLQGCCCGVHLCIGLSEKEQWTQVNRSGGQATPPIPEPSTSHLSSKPVSPGFGADWSKFLSHLPTHPYIPDTPDAQVWTFCLMNRARIRRPGSSSWAGKSFSCTTRSIQLCHSCCETDDIMGLVFRFHSRNWCGHSGAPGPLSCPWDCSRRPLPQAHQALGVQKGTQPFLPANLVILLGSPSH